MSGVSIVANGWGWQHAGRATPALAGLDLRIEAGERVLLLGPSGAGKSTLLAALAGVLGGADEGYESGELRVDGHDPARLRGTAGLVLQDPQANTILHRVGDDIAFGCENLAVPRDEIWRRVVAARDAVGLDVRLDRSTNALSGGQRQRVALAGVVAMQPGLLLLDEPTANLDPAGVAEVRDAVAAVVQRSGATLVIVEHRVAHWLPVIDRVIVLEAGGGVVADGPPAEVLAAEGATLAEDGVWVPGFDPEIERRRASEGGELLVASDLAVGRGEVVARDIDLAIGAGASIVVTGKNGTGKSTFALTLAGLIPQLGGRLEASELLADGLGNSPIRWRSKALLTRIGTVFQQPEHQFVAASVRAELAVGPRQAGWQQQRINATVDELLARLRLAHLADANPFTLSGGEQRRLSVATVLATAPKLVVLDEPTFGQDRNTWLELVTLLAELVTAGTALVSVTHDGPFVRALGDRMLDFDAVHAGNVR